MATGGGTVAKEDGSSDKGNRELQHLIVIRHGKCRGDSCEV